MASWHDGCCGEMNVCLSSRFSFLNISKDIGVFVVFQLEFSNAEMEITSYIPDLHSTRPLSRE